MVMSSLIWLEIWYFIAEQATGSCAEQARSRSGRGADCRAGEGPRRAAACCGGRIRRAVMGRSGRGERQARSRLGGYILQCTAPAAAGKEPRTTSSGRIQIPALVFQSPAARHHLHSTTLYGLHLFGICLVRFFICFQ